MKTNFISTLARSTARRLACGLPILAALSSVAYAAETLAAGTVDTEEDVGADTTIQEESADAVGPPFDSCVCEPGEYCLWQDANGEGACADFAGNRGCEHIDLASFGLHDEVSSWENNSELTIDAWDHNNGQPIWLFTLLPHESGNVDAAANDRADYIRCHQ